jgi:hypothetical protein
MNMASNVSDIELAILKAKVAKLQKRQATFQKLANECDRARKEYDQAEMEFRELAARGPQPRALKKSGRPRSWIGRHGFALVGAVTHARFEHLRKHGRFGSVARALRRLTKAEPWRGFQGKERELQKRYNEAKRHWDSDAYWQEFAAKAEAVNQARARYQAAVVAATPMPGPIVNS